MEHFKIEQQSYQKNGFHQSPQFTFKLNLEIVFKIEISFWKIHIFNHRREDERKKNVKNRWKRKKN